MKVITNGKSKIEFSNKAFIVSFIMSVLVVYIHANNLSYYGFLDSPNNIAYIIVNIIGSVFGEIAVPFFFMLSGYWFFRFDIFSRSAGEILKGKMKKKVSTVLIPYLLWNCFGMVFYMFVTRIPILSGMMNNGDIIEITIGNVLNGIFLHKYYFVFWYLQDLIVLVIATPIILLILKNKYIAIIEIAIVSVFSYLDITFYIINSSSVLFFSIGAFLAVYNRDFFETRGEKGYLWVIVFGCISVIRYFEIPIITKICYFVSPIIMWKAMDFFLKEDLLKQKVSWFKKQSFFIYAVHVIPVTVVGHIFTWFGSGTLWAVVSYLVAPMITIIGIYILAIGLNRYTPKLYGIITGNRG